MRRVLRIAVAAVLAASVSTTALAGSATYVEQGGTTRYSVTPKTLRFSVNGDLIGRHLRWSHWGRYVAKARGLIDERDYPSNGRVKRQGTVTLARLRSCHGAAYYTRALVKAHGLAWKPPKIRLYTPCDQ